MSTLFGKTIHYKYKKIGKPQIELPPKLKKNPNPNAQKPPKEVSFPHKYNLLKWKHLLRNHIFINLLSDKIKTFWFHDVNSSCFSFIFTFILFYIVCNIRTIIYNNQIL